MTKDVFRPSNEMNGLNSHNNLFAKVASFLCAMISLFIACRLMLTEIGADVS